MKNKKIMKSLFATLLCVATVAVGLPSTAKAEEVTDKDWVDWVVTNAEVRHLTDEDAKAIKADWWRCDVYSDEIYVCSHDTTVSINAENSLGKLGVNRDTGVDTAAHVYTFGMHRNEDGTIDFKNAKSIPYEAGFELGSEEHIYEHYEWHGSGSAYETYTVLFDKQYRHSEQTEDYEMIEEVLDAEGGIAVFTMPYYNDEGTLRESLIFVTSEERAGFLNYKDQPSEDNKTESYTVDISEDAKPISSSDFDSIVSENATKDVVIKSNNGVEFTFAKGTMTAVDGMENYDFGTTLITDYDSAKDTTSFVVKDNFVAQVNFNYSGKLPATAAIKIPVGKEYAGKTLNYSQLQESGIRFVQSATVDENGYITVKQDHCSNYVITKSADDNNTTDDNNGTTDDSNSTTGDNTTDDSKTAGGNASNTDSNSDAANVTSNDTTLKNSQTPSSNTNNTTTSQSAAPKTGDNADTYVWLMMIAASVGAIAVVASRKMKNA